MALSPQLIRRAVGKPVGFFMNNVLLSAKPVAAVQLLQQRNMTIDQEFTRSLPKAKYGGSHTVTLLPGEGIGPELTTHVKQIFRSTGVPIIFEEVIIDPNVRDTTSLEEAITSIRRNGVALKGNIETRSLDPGIISRNVTLRNELDLFASVFQLKSFPGVKCRRDDIDVVVIRQNTDGEYAMMEHEAVSGVVECLKVMTERNARRLSKFAFNYARQNGRKRLTIIHKANIMKASDGLFLEIARQVAKDYPEIEHKDMIIDNCCMQLVSNPQQFDVMLSTNLYGSIIVNLICGLIKGQGLSSGQDFSDEYGVFETATRNTGTQIAGMNIANPIALLVAAADMLRYLKLDNHSRRLMDAIYRTISEDKIHTADIGGNAKTSEVIGKITEHMYQSMRG